MIIYCLGKDSTKQWSIMSFWKNNTNLLHLNTNNFVKKIFLNAKIHEEMELIYILSTFNVCLSR